MLLLVLTSDSSFLRLPRPCVHIRHVSALSYSTFVHRSNSCQVCRSVAAAHRPSPPQLPCVGTAQRSKATFDQKGPSADQRSCGHVNSTSRETGSVHGQHQNTKSISFANVGLPNSGYDYFSLRTTPTAIATDATTAAATAAAVALENLAVHR